MKYKGGERGGDGDHPEQAHPQPQEGRQGVQHKLGPAGEEAHWLKHLHEVLQALPFGEVPHHVHTRGRHPQQKKGAFLIMQTQREADPGENEAQVLKTHISISVQKLCACLFCFSI